MSEQYKQTSERMSEWRSTPCVNFMPFYPKCIGGGVAVVVAVTMAAAHRGMKTYEIDAFIAQTKTASQ